MTTLKNSLMLIALLLCLLVHSADISHPDSTLAKIELLARAENGKGLLCQLDGRQTLLFLEGSPEEMGTAHGQLAASQVKGVDGKMHLIAAASLAGGRGWPFERMEEILKRSSPYLPQGYLDECDAMSRAAGIDVEDGRMMNILPELFHCSGIAVRGSASVGGKVIHARVLDYMSDIGLQRYAMTFVFMPSGRNAWLGHGYAGFIGTVTAMNEKGLAMGEMGGRGEGKWDGLPMSFLMRRVMEECATVREAVTLMRSVPLTCDYYYVISDKGGDIVGVAALSGSKEPVALLEAGQRVEQLPEVQPDTVFISGGKRAEILSQRLKSDFGKIDVAKMKEIIKRPVAMASNLHNAIFLPESGDVYISDATAKSPACDQPYCHMNLNELLGFYHRQSVAAAEKGAVASNEKKNLR